MPLPRLLKRLNPKRLLSVGAERRVLPLGGHPVGKLPIPFVDSLSDSDLVRLNHLLEWKAFVTDRRGRRFGNRAWVGKRDAPEELPDPRTVLLDRLLDLSDKSVLEVGCFEGLHTVGLALLAKKVVAVDARIENVVKTIVRCAFFDLHPTVYPHDLELADAEPPLPFVDVLHHVGVLYHLTDPVGHLRGVLPKVSLGLLLDTHFAGPGEATEEYAVGGQRFRCKEYREHGREDAFSGMRPWARWLRLEDLEQLVAAGGFTRVLHREIRNERNGPRVLLVAARPAGASGT